MLLLLLLWCCPLLLWRRWLCRRGGGGGGGGDCVQVGHGLVFALAKMSSTFQRLNPHQARLVALLKRALPLRSRDAFRALHPQPQRLMALDVGDAFVGMAMSDKWQRVALPFKDGQLRRDLDSTVESKACWSCR